METGMLISGVSLNGSTMRRRLHENGTANTAAFLSDEFMKRVKAGQDWYMFDP